MGSQCLTTYHVTIIYYLFLIFFVKKEVEQIQGKVKVPRNRIVQTPKPSRLKP